ncbi:MAG: hypothetical protein OIF50_06100 [Flavobacteriaceae bacterium]|nr:hypothetical protein [Flavobacteriaceae bacterium]
MKTLINTIFLLSTLLLQGQNLAIEDVLDLKQNYQHSYFQYLSSWYLKDPILHTIKPIKNFTEITLEGNLSNHNYRSARKEQKNSNILVSGTGFYSHKNTLFSGGISYGRNYLSKLGYNLTQLNTERKNAASLSPHYTLAYSEGDWNNQSYKLHGQLTTPLLKDKFWATIGVDYRSKEYFREIQPKPKLTNLDIQTKASLFYKFSHKHHLGLDASYGFVHNFADIRYDSRYENFPINTEIFHRISLGYGMVITATNTTIREKDKTFSGALQYLYKGNEDIIQIKGGMESLKNNFFYRIVSDNADEVIARYKANTYLFEANWWQTKKKYRWHLQTNYTVGDNFRVSTSGKNYEANLLDIDLGFYKKFNQYYFQSELGFEKLEKKDYQFVSEFETANLILGFSLSKDFAISNKSKWYWKSELRTTFNISNFYQFKETNRFVTDVALPEIAIDTAHKLQPLIGLGYTTNTNNQINYTFGVRHRSSFLLNPKNTLLKENGTNQNYAVFVRVSY